MELKPGYEQTEVGVIPSDWIVQPMGGLGAFKNGINKAAGDFGHGSPFINLMDVFGTTRTAPTTESLGLVNSTQTEQETYELRAGDVLFVRSSVKPEGVGLTALIPNDLPQTVFSGFLIRFRDRGQLAREFKEHCFLSDSFRRRLIASSTVSANTNINQDSLKLLQIGFPPLHTEQRAIATALSDVDALLDGLDQLIAKKRDLKQAAMQQLLTGQTRLPGFDEEWEVKQLGDVAHIKTGSRNNENKIEDGDYPFFVRSEIVERINTYSHDCEAILVPGEGRIGDIFHYINGRFDVHQRVYAITQFKPDMSARFVHSYMAMHFGAWAMQNTVKATVDSLRLPTFQTLEMCVPPNEEEQAAIATVLSDMDAALSALEARRDKTRDLKQAMMQELLTGKTRLVTPEVAHA